jgi:ABC-type transport system substrate-binding protein
MTPVSQPAGEPQQGGTLRFGLAAETDGWDPTSSRWAPSSYVVAGAIFDRLAAMDTEGRPQPYLAESFTPNADATAWTIRVRDGVRFHDGTPLDAAAVKRNFDERKQDPLTAANLATISSVEVVDPLTVRIDMNAPWATFPSVLAFQAGVMAAPSMLDDPDGSRRPVGTGPFRFVDWVPDSTLTVTANEDYWREGTPYLDGIEFRVLPDTASRLAALESGTVDAIQTNDATTIQTVLDDAAAGTFQVVSPDPNDTTVALIAFNMAQAPFDDPTARQIVATAIDRAQASEVGYQSVFPPAEGPFDRSSPYFSETTYPQFDLAEAQRLADEYEAANGAPLRFTLNIPSTVEVRSIAETIKQQLSAVGVEVELRGIAQDALISDALTGNYEATWLSLFGQADLESQFILLAPSSVRPVGNISLNVARNTDPELQAALDASRASNEQADRVEAYATVQERLAATIPYAWIVRQRYVIATTPAVHGFAGWTFPDGQPGRDVVDNVVWAQVWMTG